MGSCGVVGVVGGVVGEVSGVALEVGGVVGEVGGVALCVASWGGLVEVFDLNVAVSLGTKDLALPHPNVLCHLQFINRAIKPDDSHSCLVVRFAHDVDIRCCRVVGLWGYPLLYRAFKLMSCTHWPIGGFFVSSWE